MLKSSVSVLFDSSQTVIKVICRDGVQTKIQSALTMTKRLYFNKKNGENVRSKNSLSEREEQLILYGSIPESKTMRQPRCAGPRARHEYKSASSGFGVSFLESIFSPKSGVQISV